MAIVVLLIHEQRIPDWGNSRR